MATLAYTDLEAAVAAYMDVVATDLTDAEVKEWAEDALRWLLPLAPEYAADSIGADEASGSGSTGVAMPTTSVKILSVTTGLSPKVHHRYVSPEQFESIRQGYANGTSSFGSGRGVWSLVGDSIFTFRDVTTAVVRYLAAPAWGDVIYRKVTADGESFRMIQPHVCADGSNKPGTSAAATNPNADLFWAEVTHDAGHSEWTDTEDLSASGDNITVPAGWEALVAQYCAIQAKFKDEEVEQAMAMQQQLYGQLKKFAGFHDVPQSVGG